MTNQALIVPTIHRNGTSKQELLDGYIAAIEAVQEAWEAVTRVTVHGRDYYPQGEDAFITAKNQQARQMAALRAVKTELEDIAMAIYC